MESQGPVTEEERPLCMVALREVGFGSVREGGVASQAACSCSIRSHRASAEAFPVNVCSSQPSFREAQQPLWRISDRCPGGRQAPTSGRMAGQHRVAGRKEFAFGGQALERGRDVCPGGCRVGLIRADAMCARKGPRPAARAFFFFGLPAGPRGLLLVFGLVGLADRPRENPGGNPGENLENKSPIVKMETLVRTRVKTSAETS